MKSPWEKPAKTPAGHSTVELDDLSKTSLRRLEQYRDRWSSYDRHSGILAISDKPSVEILRGIELFAGLDDRFLESISPDVSLVLWRGGTVLFEQGTYLDLAFFVERGEVEVFIEGGGSLDNSQALPIFESRRMERPETGGIEHTQLARLPTEGTQPGRREVTTGGREIPFLATFDADLEVGQGMRLGPGEIFGEIGAMSGWPQSVTARTVEECQLVQIRVPALRALKRKSPALKERLDTLYRQRALRGQLRSTPLFRNLDDLVLGSVEKRVELVSLEPDQEVVQEGESAQAFYLVRSGFLKLRQRYGEGELVVTYLSKGMTLGEVELLIEGVDTYEVTASSVEYAELVKIPFDALRPILDADPELHRALWKSATGRLKEIGGSRTDPGRSAFVEQALETGLVQGNSILLIDLEQCTRCDDCVRGCASTHDGRPRFVREGERLDRFLIPRSCYHCQDPVCLVGCPTGAIHRSGVAEWVSITDEICIGCGTCARNCPYDAIVMHDTGETWPDDMVPSLLRGRERQVASKCDLCGPAGHEPACVSNCPQGCAFRVSSVDEIRRLIADEG